MATDFGFTLPPASEVPVTPHFSLVFETGCLKKQQKHLSELSERLAQKSSFCDWVSMYQAHDFPIPVIADGAVVRIDSEGNQESLTLRKQRIEGSHDSSVYLRSDGHTVWFDGNVSKLGREDNVFGYTFAQCLSRINALLVSKGLPPFSTGERHEVNTPTGWKPAWTGARITRLDLTRNFSAGSKDNAHHFMRFLSMQQPDRVKTGTHGDGETVDFGRGSRRVYSKAYLKGPELLKHAGAPRKVGPIPELSKPANPYLYQLADWCTEIGLVRFETTYKSTFLIDIGHQFLGSINMAQLEIDFENRQTVFTRATCDVDELSGMDGKILSIYRMWQAGDDLTSKFSRARFYHWRKLLLPYGVDIAVKSNVIKFEPKTRVIRLADVQMPDWYQFPSPTHIRLAA